MDALQRVILTIPITTTIIAFGFLFVWQSGPLLDSNARSCRCAADKGYRKLHKTLASGDVHAIDVRMLIESSQQYDYPTFTVLLPDGSKVYIVSSPASAA